MWWVAVVIPVMILAIVIAVVPVAVGSVRFHGWHNRRLPRRPADTGRQSGSEPSGRRVRPGRRVRCPLCLTQLEGANANEAIAARNEHFLETHVTSETPSTDLEQGRSRSA